MKADHHPGSAELVETLSTRSVTEIYDGHVVLTDLQDTLGTKGRLIVVRGDCAYSDVHIEYARTPKLWVYENIIRSQRIQNAMRNHPDHALFDGVGSSGLEALYYHARRNKKELVVVIAQEFPLPPHVASWEHIEIIRAEGPYEWGYVRKLAEVLRTRKDLIFLNHALHAIKAMAPVGNRVVHELEKLGVRPDASVFCMAGGSCLYGIGGKISEHFLDSEAILVEHADASTMDMTLDLRDPDAVRAFARQKIKGYRRRNRPSRLLSEEDLLFFPLHVDLPTLYLLQLWEYTGDIGVDRILRVAPESVLLVHERLRVAGFDWTHTTALALEPAIRLADEGKNVVAMVYGANRNT